MTDGPSDEAMAWAVMGCSGSLASIALIGSLHDMILYTVPAVLLGLMSLSLSFAYGNDGYNRKLWQWSSMFP